MLRERIITIDLDEGNYRILRYKQYDNNQILKIIIQENKEEIDLDFYTARLFFKLPSGSILEKDTTIENNRIIASIDSGILSENGRIIADLTLSSSEQLVTAFTMYLDVEETIDRNKAVQSKPEWDLITNTLNNLDTKVDKVEGKSLISNSEIERLANVNNYDDTELRNLIDTKSDITHNHDTQYASKSSEHTHDNKNALDKVTDLKVIEWDSKSDFSGSYEDLTDKPRIVIPDVNKAYVDEQLLNKSDANHTHTELHTHNNKDALDVITQEKINEWNSKSGFSGDYNDLINKPTIPTLDGYATESYVKNAIADAKLNGGSEGGSGTGSIDLSGYATKDELNAKANVSDIPTKTSQLENDSEFLTSVPSEYVTETELNAKGYLTEHQDISGKVDKVNGKSLISNSEIERLANMEDNANNYVHPSTHKASMIVEDNTHRFITDLERNNWNNKVESSQLHEHSNKDVLDGITSDKVADWDKAEENIQSDWNVTDTASDAYIKNKPSIPSKVSELTNDNLYATQTYVQNKIAEASLSGGGEVNLSGYATKDELNNKADKSSIPTKVSQLENDSNFLTSVPSEYITEDELNNKADKTEINSVISRIATLESQVNNLNERLTLRENQINVLRSDVDSLLRNNGGEDGGEVIYYYNPTMSIENDRAVFKENGYEEKFLITHVENNNDPNYRGSVQVRGSDGYDYYVLLTDNAESTNSKFRYNNLIPSHGGWMSLENKANQPYQFIPDRTYPYRNNFNFTDTVENVYNSVNSDLLNKVLEHFNNFFPAVNMQVAASSKNKIKQEPVQDPWWGAHFGYGEYFEIIINESSITSYAGSYGAGKYDYSDRGCWIHTVLHEFSHCLGLKDQPKHEPSLFNYDAPYSQLAGELFLQPNDFCALKHFYKQHYNLDITPETTQEDINNQLAQNAQVATFANELDTREVEDDELFMDFSYPTFDTTDMKVEVSDVVVRCKLKFDKEEKIQITKNELNNLSLRYNVFTIEPLEVFKGELVNNKLKIHISENMNIDENAEYLAYLMNFEDVPCSLINPGQGLEKL